MLEKYIFDGGEPCSAVAREYRILKCTITLEKEFKKLYIQK